jgi:hypothetical protein
LLAALAPDSECAAITLKGDGLTAHLRDS